MKALEKILKISGITLVLFGFVHFLLLDWLFKDSPHYLDMKWIAGKITVALTVIVFGCIVVMLTKFLFQKR